MVGQVVEEGYLDDVVQLEDWQVYGDDQVIDQDFEDCYDYWFYQGGQVVYGIIYFLFVEVSDFGQYVVQCV